jgi:chromosome segregation ATPase
LNDELEKLKKQLEELPDKWCRNKDDYCPHLAKLEAQIEKMQDDIDCLTFACENYREGMEKNLANATELEKENAILATNEKSLLAERKIIAKENTEAKNLIEELASSLSVVGECGEEECELINKAQKFINKPIF